MRLGLQVAVDDDLSEQALRGYYNLADFRMLTGDPAGSARLLELGVALARERGDRAWERDLLAQATQRPGLQRRMGRGARAWPDAARGLHDETARAAIAPWPLMLVARGELDMLGALIDPPEAESEWKELALMEKLGRAIALRAVGNDEEAKPLVFGAVADLARINNSTKGLYASDVIDMLLEYGRVDLVQDLTPPLTSECPLRSEGSSSVPAACWSCVTGRQPPSRR